MDAAEFRGLLGRFATGVTVVSTGTLERPHGMTANAFCSVSLEPPLVLVCVDHRRQTHRLIQEQGRFGISILSHDQRPLAELFASGLPELQARGRECFEEGPGGLPLVAGSLAQLECRLWAAYPGGDHSIFVGQVLHARPGEDLEPLLFFRGGYHGLGPART